MLNYCCGTQKNNRVENLSGKFLWSTDMAMQRWAGKVAVVTGASSGIGAAISKLLVQHGLTVVGIARRIDRIEELSRSLTETDEKGRLYAFRCDVTKEEDILKAFKWIKQSVGIVHVLVNNAGLTRPTTLVDGVTEEWRKVFDVNVIALCICTREAIKIMMENGINGHIVHINSVVGHYVPNMAGTNVYAASKHAVTALNTTFINELRGRGKKIKMTSVSPGAVRTEFSKNLNDETQAVLSKSGMPFLKSEDVAEAVVYVLSTPPDVEITELTIRPVGGVF